MRPDGCGDAVTVSIIMPAYNVSRYIAEAIDSALAQTYTDYEIVVVNDGSPDGEELERVLAPYRGRIVYIEQENQGCGAARNAAILASRGRYIALLDADDKWEPDYLARQLEILERDPAIDVIYSDAIIFGDRPDNGMRFMDVCPSEGEVTFESLVTGRCNVMVSVTARREMIMRAGMFDEGLKSSEDFDLWLRVVKQGGRIAYHRRPLVRYRRRRGSLSSDPVWMCRHALIVFDKVERTMRLSAAEERALGRQRLRFVAMLRFYEGKQAFFRRDIKSAIESLTEANAYFKSYKISLVLLALRAAPQLLLRAYLLRDRFINGGSTTY
jgi:glycosyltransferase involved in cell wall biosynthesis